MTVALELLVPCPEKTNSPARSVVRPGSNILSWLDTLQANFSLSESLHSRASTLHIALKKYSNEIKQYITYLTKGAYLLPHCVEEVSHDAEVRVTELKSAVNNMETIESSKMSKLVAE